jgi:hypothetical protein
MKDCKPEFKHRAPPVVVLFLTGGMMAWSWAYLSNKKGEDGFKKVVLGDMVILLVGIAMWKGDLSIIAGLR